MKTKLSKISGNTRRKTSIPGARRNIKQILATTDFSEESQVGVRYAVALAGKLGATVALIHVFEPPPRLAGMEAVALAYDDSELTALARTQMERLAERESVESLRLTSCVRTGKPFHEITTTARERAVDLIAIATHGHSGAKHLLLGSTAERVVRYAPCPVLTVPARLRLDQSGKTTPLKVKKILVPVDFSKVSKGALVWATSLATHFGAEIILVHVVEQFPIDYLLGRELREETISPLMQQRETALERMAQSLDKSTGIRISAAVRAGTPFEEICRTAKTLGADLIVLTTHGYTGLKHVWLGSTAERVVRHAACPVLVVRERDHGLAPER